MSRSQNEIDRQMDFLVRLMELVYPGAHHLTAEDIAQWKSDFTPAEHRLGLRAGFADLGEAAYDLLPKERQRIDTILLSEGFQSLTEVMLAQGKRVKRLLKKKRLVCEEDAIVLNNMLSSNLLNKEEAQQAIYLIDTFAEYLANR